MREPSLHTHKMFQTTPNPKSSLHPKNRLKPSPRRHPHLPSLAQTAERDNPRLLFLSRDDLMQHAAAHITEEQFPKHWQTADGNSNSATASSRTTRSTALPSPCRSPCSNRISPAALEWLVPGMIREKSSCKSKRCPSKSVASACPCLNSSNPISKPKPRPQHPHPAPTRPSHRQNRRRHPHTRANQSRRMGRV